MAAVLYIGGPLVIGLFVGRFTDFGRDVDPALMSTLAQVLPVVWLASLIETVSALQSALRGIEPTGEPSGPPAYAVRDAANDLRSYMLLFVVAESLLLYAVATGSPTTFLVVAGGAAGLAMMVDLYRAIRERLGLEPAYLERVIVPLADGRERARAATERDRR